MQAQLMQLCYVRGSELPRFMHIFLRAVILTRDEKYGSNIPAEREFINKRYCVSLSIPIMQIIIIIVVVIIIIITIINVFNLRYNKSCKTEVPGACKRINACTLIKSSVPKRTYL